MKMKPIGWDKILVAHTLVKENAIKSGCDDHCTTIYVINSLSKKNSTREIIKILHPGKLISGGKSQSSTTVISPQPPEKPGESCGCPLFSSCLLNISTPA